METPASSKAALEAGLGRPGCGCSGIRVHHSGCTWQGEGVTGHVMHMTAGVSRQAQHTGSCRENRYCRWPPTGALHYPCCCWFCCSRSCCATCILSACPAGLGGQHA
eukprot:GHRQ01027204.1.p1 GENE.GHRQ01027204.1~~GHRQ01027204.1.p1  ORF type:complete len:107 (+),score=16.19 GHRQ01027204.1:479-799(+)